MPRDPSVYLADGGRQQVAVEGRTQEGLAEAYREELTPLLQRGLMQAVQGIRVRGVLPPQDDAEATPLHPLETDALGLCERWMPHRCCVLYTRADKPHIEYQQRLDAKMEFLRTVEYEHTLVSFGGQLIYVRIPAHVTVDVNS